MRIAELRERLVLQEPVRTADGGGGTVVTWADVVEVWAEVKPRTGGETFAADRVSGRVSHEIVIRHREGVCPEMRFTRGARVFELRAVFDEANDRRFLTCLAEERDL
jgi:SPP1 family predicted phage head-tail adaptor